jgi:hypothetical protein
VNDPVSALPTRSDSVLFREMDEGGVLFCTRTETYFGVNRLGALIWKSLPDGPGDARDMAALVAEMQKAYPEVGPATLSADIDEFLADMAESSLVINAAGDGRRS